MSPSTKFEPPESLPNPIEEYTLLELIAQGAMGYVFRAHDPGMNAHVVLKVVHGQVVGAGIADRV